MRARVVWTADLDGQMRALRMAGLTWDAVALDMGLGRNTVLERGRRIGARRPRPQQQPIAMAEEAADRPTRPPGHPDTWGLITAGTVLQGAPYPFPVFL
ncbi:MAG: AsnC family protein, partial [Rhodospirillales bacterium]